MAMDSAKRVMSGTWGELWLDDYLISEVYKFQSKITFNKEDVAMCGDMWTDFKIKNISGKGSIGMRKVNSLMIDKLLTAMNSGRDLRFKIITKLDDPDAYGQERSVIHNVSFDDLTIADWEAGVFGNIEAPFTHGKVESLDKVGY